ncbi:VOC family protein [Pyxidicoccus sp. 3LG]
MTIAALKPFIPSGKDFAAARSFFLALGFVVNWEGQGLVELQLGAAVFLLQDFHNPTVQENLILFAQVDDLDAWWKHLQECGVLDRYPGVRAKEPTVYPWGQREVHLIDPAGVCWHFA